MSKKTSFIFAAVFIAAILFIGFRSGSLVKGYAFKADMAEASASTLAALAAVVLIVERAMASVNAIVFGTEQRAADLASEDDQRHGLIQLSKVLGDKERARILGSFIAGLFISAAGVRTLEGLLETTALSAPANSLLYPVDVVLTAALIAGGSNGLAFLLGLTKEKLMPKGEKELKPTEKEKEQRSGLRGRAQPEGPSPSIRARLITTG